jgi:streptogramin lyase
VGRIVRIDPRRGRVVGSVTVDRPHALAVGPRGVYVNDFWRGTVRRFDPIRLRTTATLRLVLPFEVAPGDDAFLPFDVEVDNNDVWVSTVRGALARLDLRLSRVLAMVRIPSHTSSDIVAGDDAVWVAESLLGVYRIDQATNRVVARIRIGPPRRRFVVDRLLLGAGKVLGVGSWTTDGVLTDERGLARIDPSRNRVEGVTPLPSGPLAVAFGKGSLWVGRSGGSSLQRIDPRTGEVVASIDAEVGSLLAVTDTGVWTAARDGTLRRIAP